MSTTGWVVLGVVVVIVIWAISVYNGLVAMRQRTNQAFADIDVQLKLRHDLIPNLVETVKGYAAHERGTLEAVIAARQTAIAAPGVEPISASRFIDSCESFCSAFMVPALERGRMPPQPTSTSAVNRMARSPRARRGENSLKTNLPERSWPHLYAAWLPRRNRSAATRACENAS